jgi:gamma-glutamyltranspeptidase / glutathione hydrolase
MSFTTRPTLRGTHGVLTSGHYLATAAGFRIAQQGGNAIDAAAAMCICLNLLEPQNNGIGGEAPTLVYSAADKKAYALSGQGWSPAAFTIEWCRANDIDLIPGDGYLPACVPATLDTWAMAVARWGTLGFGQILAPAIELAEEGFPMYRGLHNHLRNNFKKYTELYPSTGEIYLRGGHVPEVGEVWRNPDFGATLRLMVRAEEAHKGKSRVAGIEAARDVFYKGDIAARIVDFTRTTPVLDASGKAHTGLLTIEDFAEWHAHAEETASVTYRGLQVHKCGPWTQGPVFLQQLTLLEAFDLRAMGHNSAEYLHTLIEVIKLAFADREAYYGDPNFDAVPLDLLLSAEYAGQRREYIDDVASREMLPGDLGAGAPAYATTFDVQADNRAALNMLGAGDKTPAYTIKHAHLGDTTHCDAIDRAGNMVSCTPSGGWIGTSPVIRGLGFSLGTRGQMFYLNPDRPNALAPHKRPRATLTPSLVTRNGAPHMVFGTPGGDAQDQLTMQQFLNMVEFGMNPQEALDAPTVHSVHFPSSFYPRAAYPARIEAEDRIPAAVLDALRARGHDVSVVDGWSNGKCMGIVRDDAGVMHGGVSPRGEIGYGLAW